MNRLLMTTALIFAGSTSLVLAQDATDPNATVAPVEEGVTDMPAEDGMTDDAMTDDAMTDDAMTDDAMTDDAMTDDAMTDDAMTDDAMTDAINVNPMQDIPGWIEPEGFMIYSGEALTADILLNASVYDVTNNSVSSLSDFVLDDEGAISHAIIDVGGFLGIGQRSVAIPFEDLVIYQAVDIAMTDGVVMDGTTGVVEDGVIADGTVTDPNIVANDGLTAGDLRIYLPMTEEQLKALPEVDI